MLPNATITQPLPCPQTMSSHPNPAQGHKTEQWNQSVEMDQANPFHVTEVNKTGLVTKPLSGTSFELGFRKKPQTEKENITKPLYYVQFGVGSKDFSTDSQSLFWSVNAIELLRLKQKKQCRKRRHTRVINSRKQS